VPLVSLITRDSTCSPVKLKIPCKNPYLFICVIPTTSYDECHQGDVPCTAPRETIGARILAALFFAKIWRIEQNAEEGNVDGQDDVAFIASSRDAPELAPIFSIAPPLRAPPLASPLQRCPRNRKATLGPARYIERNTGGVLRGILFGRARMMRARARGRKCELNYSRYGQYMQMRKGAARGAVVGSHDET